MSFSMIPHRDRLSVKPGQLYIGNRWCDAQDGELWIHRHPATNEELTTIAVAGPADVDRAVRVARAAFDEGPWPTMKARERKRILQRVVDLIYAHADEITQLQTLDNGIPMSFGRNYRVSAEFAADVFDHHAGWIDKINGEVYPQYSGDMNMQYISMREPVGVVAGITPWNAPLLQFPEKVAPALATGCCIIMKPSEFASLAVLRMSELISQAGLPPGVFQLLTGDATTGDALVKHSGIDKIAFTGSRAVGEYLQAVAAKGLKKVSLELGGKSAALIFPDAADVTAACKQAMAMLSTGLSGQVCSITSRALVHESIYDQFIDAAREQVKGVRFGDPFDIATTSAPLINRKQLEKVAQYVELGQREGAKLEFGGDRPAGEFAEGNWFNPTLFSHARNDMRIAQEEIFGPVLTSIPFSTEDEAIRLANQSEYGLSAGIYTSNVNRAFRVGKALRTGTVGINGYSFMPNSPFGGYKASGAGREGGFASIEAFTELKTMMFNLN
jgi:aldehyde dehydrogenase (NAD+)